MGNSFGVGREVLPVLNKCDFVLSDALSRSPGPRLRGQQRNQGSVCLHDSHWFNDSSWRMRSHVQPPCFPLPCFIQSFDLVIQPGVERGRGEETVLENCR